MYSNVLVPIDNSVPSRDTISAAAWLGRGFGASMTCLHVYAAKLHERSFVKLEPFLPHEYRDLGQMAAQREFHGALIEKGLRSISESYVQKATETLKSAGLQCVYKSIEGKNFQVIVEEAANDPYNLIIMGAHGWGKERNSILGSVCHRVVRTVNKDTLIIKNAAVLKNEGEIMVALDGSLDSFTALNKALELALALDMKVSAVTVYDPQFHYRVFKSLMEVLSKEAQSIFPLEHQERLHTAVIDKGLKNVAQGYLEHAKKVGAERGLQVDTHLLEGKPFSAILDLLEERRPSLLVTGKHGSHHSELSTIGSNTENLLLLSSVNQLVAGN